MNKSYFLALFPAQLTTRIYNINVSFSEIKRIM